MKGRKKTCHWSCVWWRNLHADR